MPNAIILSVGDELVLGQTVDTNSAWISRKLAAAGCAVTAHLTAPDDQPAIEDAIREAARRCDFLIVSGGIGPTPDDLTRQALAAVMNVPLELNASWLAHVRDYFKQRQREMPEMNSIQAMIPRGGELICNPCGTAAGIRARLGSCEVFILPGVPSEMKMMFEQDVMPAVAGKTAGAIVLSRALHTFGLGESAIAEKLGVIMERGHNPSVGTTVADGIVSLRVNVRAGSKDQGLRDLDATVSACRAALGDVIFGEEDESLQQAVAKLLLAAHQTVATAESCTGGLLAKMLTDVPGSSEYFGTGFITYSNEAKYQRLGVSREIINIHGAVSEPVVQLMAKHARRLAKSDYALAISGVAGPSGGTPTKPVGTVCLALAISDSDPPVARTFHFPGDRASVRDRSAKMALTMLRYQLLGRPMPV